MANSKPLPKSLDGDLPPQQHSHVFLDDGELLVLKTRLAVRIGVNEAIFLQQLHYWLKNKKIGKYDDKDRKWVKNSLREWQSDNFPFWSDRTIKRIILKLRRENLISTRTDLNPKKTDRTTWYSINYDNEKLKFDSEQRGSNRSSCPHPLGQVDPMDKAKLTPCINKGSTEITSKTTQREKTCETFPPKSATPENQNSLSQFLSEFWAAFPKRNGTHSNKIESEKVLKSLPIEERSKLLQAVKFYTACKDVRDGIIRHPNTWLRDWRAWIPQTSNIQERLILIVGSKSYEIPIDENLIQGVRILDQKNSGVIDQAREELTRRGYPKFAAQLG